MSESKIEWTDETWNPTRGCVKVSPGCANCYAERFAERFRGVKGHPYEQGFDIRLVPEKLADPLKLAPGTKVFVNSMSDIFFEEIPDRFIDSVFAAMADAPHVTFQVLTKRARRMREYIDSTVDNWGRHGCYWDVPLPNVWLGISAEDQQRLDERVPDLLATPAAVRWLSIEPLLGPITAIATAVVVSIDWVVVGGESGPRARPMHPDWARSIRDQCVEAHVPFFFKQWGEFLTAAEAHNQGLNWTTSTLLHGHAKSDPAMHAAEQMARVGKKAAGRELDGRVWDEMPEAPTRRGR